MRFVLKLSAALLIVVLAASAFGMTLAPGVGSSAQERPARCHERGSPAPKRPVDTGCCARRHDLALVQSVTALTALLPDVTAVFTAPEAATMLGVVTRPLTRSGDPPGLIPIRI